MAVTLKQINNFFNCFRIGMLVNIQNFFFTFKFTLDLSIYAWRQLKYFSKEEDLGLWLNLLITPEFIEQSANHYSVQLVLIQT